MPKVAAGYIAMARLRRVARHCKGDSSIRPSFQCLLSGHEGLPAYRVLQGLRSLLNLRNLVVRIAGTLSLFPGCVHIALKVFAVVQQLLFVHVLLSPISVFTPFLQRRREHVDKICLLQCSAYPKRNQSRQEDARNKTMQPMVTKFKDCLMFCGILLYVSNSGAIARQSSGSREELRP